MSAVLEVLPLGECDSARFGGKARGLARLIAMGLRVPKGFAIAAARDLPDSEPLPPKLSAHYAALGDGAVAVRSSALDEDGALASFAGQYETVLGVEGELALRRAIEKCVASLSHRGAQAYRERTDSDSTDGTEMCTDGTEMCVVVQRMVNARAAGVLFTVDPATNRRAHVVIDAVAGLGEALVAGEASPDHHVLDRSGCAIDSQIEGKTPVLTGEELQRLVAEALEAEARFGQPLDLEWAIDCEGDLFWLQARPITTLGPDLNELDSPIVDPHAVYTRCNVGEMFPGAATPLSISFTGRAIDVAMQQMHIEVGIQPDTLDANKFIAVFYGHLFLNLTTLAEISTHTFGSTIEQMSQALCGRPITEFEIRTAPPPPLSRRIPNGLRYLRYLLGQRSARRSLRELSARLVFPEAGDAASLWQSIDSQLPVIHRAMHDHLVSSAGAGALTPALLAIFAAGEEPSDEHHALVAELLAGTSDVESADIAAGVVRIQERVRREPDLARRLAALSLEEAVEWFSGPESGEAGREYGRYLERHGHRAVKELELRQPEWALDPTPLVASIRAPFLAAGGASEEPPPQHQPTDAGGTDAASALSAQSLPIRWLVRLTRQTVRSREETKSGIVRITTQFKAAYRDLGRRLVREGLLDDEDSVFFLAHEELGELVQHERADLSRHAQGRRQAFALQMELGFPDVFTAEPSPLSDLDEAELTQDFVKGSPVSRGSVTGIARVVRSLDEAMSLRAGEILIAPVTDVGWTPYFSMIAALVTDVGSSVSHGAVVAREYGLPAVVNTRVGTRVFATGDTIRVDGATGIVRRVPDVSTSG